MLQMQHCSSVQLLLGNVLSTSFHMLAGKENKFTCIYTRSQCDLYTVTKSQKIGCEHRRLRRPGGREAGKEEEASSAPLCSSSDSTGDPAAVNLKAEDHSSLLVFSFLLFTLWPFHISASVNDFQYLISAHYICSASHSRIFSFTSEIGR